jgi:hypothetical protein
MTMIKPQVPLPPSLAQRILSQLRTHPQGEGRTAAEIAGQMVGMDAQSMLGYLKDLGKAGIVLGSECPPTKVTRWRLGLWGIGLLTPALPLMR